MGRSKWIRPVSALVAAAVIIAGCSSDDDSSSESTVPATTEATEASAPTTEAGLTGEGLELGLLAPSPGLLATLFQGQERGSGFAADDVNDGGGVLDLAAEVLGRALAPGHVDDVDGAHVDNRPGQYVG